MEMVAREMRSFFSWANDSNLLFWIVLATFAISLTILAILVSRGGRSADAAATIREVRKVGEQVEGMRSQNSNEHGPMQDYVVWIHGQLRRLLERFGFLDARDVVNDIKKRLKDDDTH